MHVAPDLFSWAETRPTAVIIDARQIFHRREEAVVTRLLFGPPYQRFDDTIIAFDRALRLAPKGRRRSAEQNRQVSA